jgi:hypothetical protein
MGFSGLIKVGRIRALQVLFLTIGITLLTSIGASASWYTGLSVGYDSNIDRAISGGKSDTYLTPSLSFLRGHRGESRLDWTFAANLEASAFSSMDGLNNVSLTLSPGLAFIPHLNWRVSLVPFVQGKVVQDGDQSALAFGGKLTLRQQIRKDFYTGQYFIYKDSRANVDTYSFAESILGVFIGINWAKTFFSEFGYEFSHGDSFRTLSTTSVISAPGSGRGKHLQYSSAFGADVIREIVDQQSFSVHAGIDWTPSFYSYLTYIYSTMKGDSGVSNSHKGFVGVGYRF